MKTPVLLGAGAIAHHLTTLRRAAPDWRVKARALRIRFEFADFVDAFGFMTEVALVAERMQHHPQWTNEYKTVSIVLSTHSAGGLTELDFRLAKRISAIAHRPRG